MSHVIYSHAQLTALVPTHDSKISILIDPIFYQTKQFFVRISYMNQTMGHFMRFIFVIIYSNIGLCKLLCIYPGEIAPKIYIFTEILIGIKIWIYSQSFFIHSANFSQELQEQNYHILITIGKVHCNLLRLCLFSEPGRGVEPPTYCLQNSCSAIELSRQD